MNCDEVKRDQLLEKYLAGKLAREQRDPLESHLRSCVQCGPRLRKLRVETRGEQSEHTHRDFSVQVPSTGAPAKSRGIRTALIISGIAVVLAFGLVLWLKPKSPEAKLGEKITPVHVQIKEDNLQLTRDSVLQELSMLSPLPSRAPVEAVPGGVAERHRAAMQLYAKGQLPQASAAFEEVLGKAPGLQHAQLYLGVCYALTGDNARADETLRKLAGAAGPYRDEARFYLAKSLLAQRDVEGGAAEMRTLAASSGTWANEARRLLPLLDKVK